MIQIASESKEVKALLLRASCLAGWLGQPRRVITRFPWRLTEAPYRGLAKRGAFTAPATRAART
jgi:hypothetical protein